MLPVHESYYKGETRQFTFARALYEFLGIKTRFNDWFNRAVADADFIENADYWFIFPNKSGNVCYSNLSNKKRTNHRGGHNKADYKITLDMAKELAMLERNEQGKLARSYFIQCEKALQTVAPQLSSELLLQWKASREQTGKGYRPLCAALDRNRSRQGKPTPKYLYGNESNMLTGIVLGMSVKHYKTVHGIEDDVRSHLTAD
ncbi:antA/AntB antirepressor family protein [Muribacter muris]|uniref:antA/AntB antirepressor family protein n=1 Tax=Muribacter muris TaxID=67855 RepID=UPI00069F7073|nr:antA/AntB antirepressor family protein [Muribacter muris]